MKKTLILSMALLLALSTTILADPGFGRGRGQGDCGPGMKANRQAGGMQHILGMADDLKLTDQQVDQLEGMQVTFKTERIDMKAEVDKARVQMGALMKDDASERDVNAAIDKLTSLQADMKKMQYRHHQAVLQVLTPEQQDELDDLRQSRRQARFDCDGDGPHFERKGQRGQRGQDGKGAGRGL